MKNSKAVKNQSNGKFWEECVFQRAQMNGLLPKRNLLTAQYTYNNNYQVLKSNLDLTIISVSGMVGYFDCKSFDDNFFTFSKIDSDQMERAAEYNKWSVPAGFLVYFRPVNRVCFFSGFELLKAGPGSRFDCMGGLFLGRLESFDLKPLFAKL